MKTIKKLLPLILSINFAYAQDAKFQEITAGDGTSASMSALEKIAEYLLNLGRGLGYDLRSNLSSTSATTDTLLDDGSTQKKLENYTVQMYFSFIGSNLSYPTFLPKDSSSYATVFNALCGTVFGTDSFTPATTSDAIDLQYKSSDNSSNGFYKYPVSQFLYNMLYITSNDACIGTSGSTSSWNTTYAYCEAPVLARAIGLDIDNADLQSTKTEAPINTLGQKIAKLALSSYFPTSNPSDKSIELIKQLDSTSFIGPLMYDSSSSSSSTAILAPSTSSQQEAAQNFVRYITAGIKPKVYASYSDLSSSINNIYASTDINTQINYFKPLASFMLDFRIYAARLSIPVQFIYDFLAKRMASSSNTSSSDSSNTQQSSQALNEYVMASYRLYNPNATDTSTDSSTSSLTTTAWQDMINTASPPTVQKESALLLAEINYQLYQLRLLQEKALLINSVSLISSLPEPSLSMPSASDASSTLDSSN